MSATQKNLLQKTWDFSKNANQYWKDSTQPVKGKTLDERVQSFTRYFNLKAQDQQRLSHALQQPDGEAFFEARVRDVNRHATHRAAFIANAGLQLGAVDLGSVALLSLLPAYYLKAAFVTANLGTASLAWRQMHVNKNRALNGPEQAPKRTFIGMLFGGNRKRHNQFMKRKAQPHKSNMKNERLYMSMYAANAVTPLIGSEVLFSNYLPSMVKEIANLPTYVTSVASLVANGYWAYQSNKNVITAATQRGNVLDKMKI